MFCLRKPTDQVIREYLVERQEKPFSYEPVNGTTQHSTKEEFEADLQFQGYDVAQHRFKLGNGEECFRKAVAGVKEWKTFDMEWVQLCFPELPVQVGTTVAVIARQIGFWVVSFCRVVYVIDEWDESGQVSRYGFAYGTLDDHVVKGEERFVVEWNHEDDGVYYDLLAFSSPRHWLSQIGYPVAKHIQEKFATESGDAMQRAVGKTTVTQI